MPSTRPTIFALSSGRGPAAIAVVRISGPRAGAALVGLGVKIPEPRKAGLARLRDPLTQEIIDEALVLWFPAPHSETGEDVAELQLHGGRAVIAATLAALSRIEGLKPAEAGEFTRRAFENGKLDLTAVEGLADLVMAETEGQRRQALRQMKGLLGNRAESWRQRLIQALALVEARIDFSDEADVPENLVEPALTLARELTDEIAAVLADGGRGERLREGLVVAIAGPPNAGKSTLLNRIARREAAIVSPYAGTTRDVIEVHLELGGLPVTLLDTTGIRDTDDPVELEGVRRACERAAAADLVLWVVDASAPVIPGRSEGSDPESITPVLRSMDSGPAAFAASRNDGESRPPAAPASASRDLLPIVEIAPPPSPASGAADTAQQTAFATAPRPPTWLIRNKIDLLAAHQKSEPLFHFKYKSEPRNPFNNPLKSMVNNELTHNTEHVFTNNEIEFILSATTGEGFDRLLQALAGFAESFMAGAEQAVVTRQRHRFALEETLAALRRAQAGDLAGREDLLAEELRIAARALGRLTGRVDVEDILDVIFRDFCIGK
ncbi:MAG: tRNA uridine-5-carboxymethylaminomethyl(34) synthesis GTPase MnmE [Rhizobiales bacterium]|nr:tRNA uridine-5-carboxymethylaminomethyl(34) synthesis GTPase MnmE [Hyphomicrobiales bacterium]